MDDAGELRKDIKVPDSDVGREIREKHGKGETLNGSLLSACGEELIIAVKHAKEN